MKKIDICIALNIEKSVEKEILDLVGNDLERFIGVNSVTIDLLEKAKFIE